MTGRRLVGGLAALLLAAGLWQLGAAGLIQGKAWLAQLLLARAWAASLDSGRPVRPWPWSDAHPLARLSGPGLGAGQLVLSDGSARSLAFGPGHVAGSVAPGAPGVSVIAGHRDTHFAGLRHLRPGDRLRLQTADGAWQAYRVTATEVLPRPQARVDPGSDRPTLVLVTCWPFDAVSPGGPERYAVTAEAEAPAGQTTPQPTNAARSHF